VDAPFRTHPECPSELRLDRFSLAELAREDADQVRAHVDGCARCKERVEFRERGLGAFGGLDSARMVSAIAAKLGTAANAPALAKKRRRAPVLPILASIAALFAALAVMYPRERTDEVRAKGELGLTIYRERAGKVEQLAAGDRVRAHDRLRFVVGVPESAQEIMIVSVEEGGKIFAYYPSDGTKRSRAPKITADGALEGAIELDSSLAGERVHLVACKKPFTLDELKAGPRPDLLDIPKDCESASFGMLKEGAP
jgi:hypothetical protein